MPLAASVSHWPHATESRESRQGGDKHCNTEDGARQKSEIEAESVAALCVGGAHCVAIRKIHRRFPAFQKLCLGNRPFNSKFTVLGNSIRLRAEAYSAINNGWLQMRLPTADRDPFMIRYDIQECDDGWTVVRHTAEQSAEGVSPILRTRLEAQALADFRNGLVVSTAERVRPRLQKMRLLWRALVGAGR